MAAFLPPFQSPTTFGLRVEHLVDDGRQGAGVGDLAESLPGDDVPGVLAGPAHRLEHVLCHPATDGAVVDQGQEAG